MKILMHRFDSHFYKNFGKYSENILPHFFIEALIIWKAYEFHRDLPSLLWKTCNVHPYIHFSPFGHHNNKQCWKRIVQICNCLLLDDIITGNSERAIFIFSPAWLFLYVNTTLCTFNNFQVHNRYCYLTAFPYQQVAVWGCHCYRSFHIVVCLQFKDDFLAHCGLSSFYKQCYKYNQCF